MKKTKKAPCENCGDMTNFGNATGDRAKIKWCAPCFKMRERYSIIPNNGGERVWREPKLYGTGRGGPIR